MTIRICYVVADCVPTNWKEVYFRQEPILRARGSPLLFSRKQGKQGKIPRPRGFACCQEKPPNATAKARAGSSVTDADERSVAKRSLPVRPRRRNFRGPIGRNFPRRTGRRKVPHRFGHADRDVLLRRLLRRRRADDVRLRWLRRVRRSHEIGFTDGNRIARLLNRHLARTLRRMCPVNARRLGLFRKAC